MAKPLQERIASALSTDRVTITTLEELIPEAEAERDRLGRSHVQAAAESVDFALSEEDRDEAAGKSERHSRNATALTKAIDQLTEKLAAKRESESYRAAQDEKAAVLADRDDLAKQFRELVPVLVDQLAGLFAAVQLNADRMRDLRINQADAEAVARGHPGFIGRADEPERFLTMKLPNFAGNGRCWPPEQRLNVDLGRDEYVAARKRMQEEQARWKRYIVTPPEDNREPITFQTRRGVTSVRSSPAIEIMCPEQAAAVRALGCKAEIAGANVSIGLPMVGNF